MNQGLLISLGGVSPPVVPGTPSAVYAVDYAPSVLNAALMEASHYEDIARINDISGNGHHLTKASSRDKLLKFEGIPYVFVNPITSGDEITIPASSLTNITGDMELELYARPVLWSGLTQKYMMSKTLGTFCWHLRAENNTLIFVWYTVGAVSHTAVSTANIPFADNTPGWIRVEYIQNTGSGQYSVIFRTSTDPPGTAPGAVVYTQLGVALTGVMTTGTQSAVNIIQIGSASIGSYYVARIYSAGSLAMQWRAVDTVQQFADVGPLSGGSQTGDAIYGADAHMILNGGGVLRTSLTGYSITTPFNVPANSKSGTFLRGAKKATNTAGVDTFGSGTFGGGPYSFHARESDGSVFTANQTHYYGAPTTVSWNGKLEVITEMLGSAGRIRYNGADIGSGAGIAYSPATGLTNFMMLFGTNRPVWERAGVWGGTLPSDETLELYLNPSGYNIVQTTISGSATRIQRKRTVTSATPVTFVLYFHGDGENQNSAYAAPAKNVVERLISDGCIVATTVAAGSGWGNAASMAIYKAVYDYVLANFNVVKVIFVGQSMGGLASLNLIAGGTVNVAGWYGISPVTNLADVYANGFSVPINTAYGITNPPTYATQTNGFDPNLKAASVFASVSIRMLASYTDGVISRSNNTDLMQTKCQGTSPSVTTLTFVGAHGSQASFLPDDISSFVAAV